MGATETFAGTYLDLYPPATTPDALMESFRNCYDRMDLDTYDGEILHPDFLFRFVDGVDPGISPTGSLTREQELTTSIAYLEVCRECDAPKPKEACVDCKRERPVAKPVLVSGLHADVGWVDGRDGAAPFSNGESAEGLTNENPPQNHRETRS